jgi:hypothetical protein
MQLLYRTHAPTATAIWPSQKFRMLVRTLIEEAPALEKLGGQVPSCRFRALRPFYQYTLLP